MFVIQTNGLYGKKPRKLNRTRNHRWTRKQPDVYAQVISSEDGNVLAAASTLQKDVAADLKGTSNKEAAAAVGKAVAERAVEAGVKDVAFDRSGYRYHGRVKELADAAREVGLNF